MLQLNSIDWSTWTFRERCVLCFVRKENQLLLIRKKRGLGAGKINGPGGRIDPGETPRNAAIRETREETGIIPQEPQPAGLLHFVFLDGLSIHCTVFQTNSFAGDLQETDEAVPFWRNEAEIPFHEMWEDDALWFPYLLKSIPFSGFFLFDGEKMLDNQVQMADLSSV